MAQCPIKSCEICESSPGSRFCVDCEQYFCNVCEISHLKTKACKHHVFQHAHTINPEEKTPVCEKHDERFLYFCNTCSCLLCSICLTSSHKKHEFCLIDEAGSQKRSEFNIRVKSFETDILTAENKVEVMKKSLEEFKDATENAKKKLEEKRKSLIDVINDIADGYLEEIDEIKSTKSQRIEQDINKRRDGIEKNRESINYVKTSASKQNNTIFLVSVTEMSKTIPSFKSQENVSELPVSVFFEPAQTIITDIQKIIGALTLSVGATLKSSNAPISAGSLVRIKQTTQSRYGVIHGSVGKVKQVFDDNSVLVTLSKGNIWSGMLNAIEHVE